MMVLAGRGIVSTSCAGLLAAFVAGARDLTFRAAMWNRMRGRTAPAAVPVVAIAACCASIALLLVFWSSSSLASSLLDDATTHNSTIVLPTIRSWTDPQPSSLSYKQRKDLFEPHKYDLLVCRLVPTQCARQDVLMSAAFMHSNIMHMGSSWLCVLTMLPLLVRGDCDYTHVYAVVDKNDPSVQEMVSISTSTDSAWPSEESMRRRNGKEGDVEGQSLLGAKNDNDQNDEKKKGEETSHLERLMDYWTGGRCRLPPFAYPVLTIKLFLVALIWLELQDIMAPSQSVLATPEMVWLMAQAPKTKKYVPNMAKWLLFPLMGKGQTIGGLVVMLGKIRGLGLIAWLMFLTIPERRSYSSWASTICYTLGAVSYFFLGSIGLMYKLSHSTQGGLLFVVATSFAIPPLFAMDKDQQIAGSAWLRRFLFLGILIPIYLMSGIAKIRYVGILTNLNGRWLWELFEPNSRKYAAWTSLRNLLYNHKVLLTFMSWGNLVLEIFLPLALILKMESAVLRMSFHGIALAFHISIFFLVGPNFGRYCLLHILAFDPIGWFRVRAGATEIGPSITLRSPSRSKGDFIRVGVATLFLFGWFRVQLLSDIEHLLGRVEQKKKRDPYFPFSEFSMFASVVDPNYIASFLLVLVSMAVYYRCFFVQK